MRTARPRLAARLGALAGAASERPFAFEHDGVLFHGFLDVLHLARRRARSSSTSSRTFSAGSSPPTVVESDYRLQRLVYAIACFRAGADEVEVVYQFLERPDDLVAASFRRDELPALEAELSAAIGAHPRRRVPSAAERVRLRRLPGAGRRLRRARPAR